MKTLLKVVVGVFLLYLICSGWNSFVYPNRMLMIVNFWQFALGSIAVFIILKTLKFLKV